MESFLNLSMNPSAFGSIYTVPSSFMPGLISSSISQIASRCSSMLYASDVHMMGDKSTISVQYVMGEGT